MLKMNPESMYENDPLFAKTVHAAEQHAHDVVSTGHTEVAHVWLSRVDGRTVVHSVTNEMRQMFQEVTAGRETKMVCGYLRSHGETTRYLPVNELKDWRVRW